MHTTEQASPRTLWFITGSQSLYGEETLRQVAEQSQVVARTIAEQVTAPVEIVWKPTVTTSEEIRRTLLAATADDSCIGVITWMHTFSPAKMWIHGLDVLHKPLLHLHTQAGQSLPWATIDMDFMNLNQAAHGDREYAHILTRVAQARTIVVGHPSDAEVGRKVTDWAYAALGWHTMRTLRIARFGDNMRYVAVTDGDKTGAQIKLGMSIEAYGVNTLVDAVAQVTDAEATTLAGEYEELYAVAPELRAGGDRHDSLVYAAKQEIALRSLLVDGGFSGFTTNFEDLGGLRQLPGMAVQRLMADGYGFGGEGDWKTSALLATMKAMTPAVDGRPGPTSFMEDYTYHFGPGPQRILGAHMLEVCPTIAAAKPTVEIHPLGIGGREDPVRMVFTAAPGHGQVVCLVDLGDRFRFIANDITVVPPDEDLPKLPVARAVWEPAPDLPTSAEAWMLAGGCHHTVLSTGVSMSSLESLALMADTELVVIDQGTRIRGLRQELRWSSAFHRLADRFA